MSKATGHYPWWGFWRIVLIPVVIHSVFLLIGSVGMFFTVPDPTSIHWRILSPLDATALYLSRFESIIPYVAIASLLVVIGFSKARLYKRSNRILITYAVLQILVGALVTCAYLYLIQRGFIVIQKSAGGMNQTRMALGRGDFHAWAIAYLFISLPLVLLVIRGLWVLIVKPKPAADESGRYLLCSACGYDLRGTTGDSCPECGASVMVKNTNTSTAAD